LDRQPLLCVEPLDYSIRNKDNANHSIYIEIAKAESGEVIYKANHTVGPRELINSKPITDKPGSTELR
jgi:hypothetical protein